MGCKNLHSAGFGNNLMCQGQKLISILDPAAKIILMSSIIDDHEFECLGADVCS